MLTPAAVTAQSKDSYLPYNKPMSIIHWLQNAKPKSDVIVIMDPDCLIFKPIDIVRWHDVAAACFSHAAAGCGAGPADWTKGVF
jgi:hypothetical protein